MFFAKDSIIQLNLYLIHFSNAQNCMMFKIMVKKRKMNSKQPKADAKELQLSDKTDIL